jgi:hypothetical protein
MILKRSTTSRKLQVASQLLQRSMAILLQVCLLVKSALVPPQIETRLQSRCLLIIKLMYTHRVYDNMYYLQQTDLVLDLACENAHSSLTIAPISAL